MIVGTILLLLALGALILHLFQKISAKNKSLFAIKTLLEQNDISCVARDQMISEVLVKAGYSVAFVRKRGACSCNTTH